MRIVTVEILKKRTRFFKNYNSNLNVQQRLNILVKIRPNFMKQSRNFAFVAYGFLIYTKLL